MSNVDYLHGRALLMEADRRRKNGGHVEARVLTYSQIRHYVDQDWERACAIAQLRSASHVPTVRRRGVSTPASLCQGSLPRRGTDGPKRGVRASTIFEDTRMTREQIDLLFAPTSHT